MTAADDLTQTDLLRMQAKVIRRLRDTLREIARESDGHVDWCKKKGYNDPKTSMRVSELANDALGYLDMQGAKLDAKRKGALDRSQERLF